MPHRYLALAPAVALAFVACSGAGSTASPTSSAPSPSGPAGAAVQRIEVKLNDSLKMDPAEMMVKAGQPVTFVVMNSGAIDHEFYLGDEGMQAQQEQMMQSGQMAHDTAEGISLKPGESKELTYTFPAVGQFTAGCHVTGHYAAGMKAMITVTP